MNTKNLVSYLCSQYPEKASACGPALLNNAVVYFEHIFGINAQSNTYSCGSLEQLALFLGRDYRNSDLLFDVAKTFSEIFDPEYCVTLDTWESSIRDVVGENTFSDAFEEWLSNFERFRIVLTCFDPGEAPYADFHDDLFPDLHSAHEKAKAMAKAECAYLNDEEGAYPPGTIDGVFEVDDCANNDFEVRWYEKSLENRQETDCDIEWVTNYNVYPVTFNEDGPSWRYRGFEISSSEGSFAVSHKGASLKMCDTLKKAFELVDDVCLVCAKDKTYALESVHKLPLDVRLKFAESKQQTADEEARSIAANETRTKVDTPHR